MEKRILHLDVYVGIALLLFGVFGVFQTKGMPKQAAAFPKLILTMIIVLGTAQIILGVLKTGRMKKSGETISALKFLSLRPALTTAAMAFLYIFGVWKIGFYVATAVFIAVMMIFFHERSVKRILLTTGVLLVFLYVVFSWQLGVIMPKALLF